MKRLLVALPFALPLFAQETTAPAPAAVADDIVLQGKFVLHKFEQPIGAEEFVLRKAGDGYALESKFKFTDRGSPVPLTAHAVFGKDWTPRHFDIKGNVSRFSTIDSAVDVDEQGAHVRVGKEARDVKLPGRFFAISGYAPAAMQMLLVRYLDAHPGDGALATLPEGSVTVQKRGKDTVKIGERELVLERYAVGGLIWGQEELWIDGDRRLAALVSIDAEFDHFEAIREDCVAALPTFVSRAAADGMAALTQLSGAKAGKATGVLAIRGATLIDGTDKPPVADAVVVVEGERIVAAGPAATVAVPKEARVLDARGKWLIPGLWDMHAHFEQVEWGPVYLAAGVTTARDCGNEFDFITAVRDTIDQGLGIGPRLVLAGIVDGDSRMALGIVRANDEASAKAVVARYKAAGFQQIKIYSSVKKPVVAAICAAAHAAGMTVTGHIPGGMSARDGIEAGMDQINHIQYLPDLLRAKEDKGKPLDLQSPAAQDGLAFLRQHGTVVDPTLVIFEWAMHPQEKPFVEFEPGVAKVPAELAGQLNNSGVPGGAASRASAQFAEYVAIVGALHRAGVPLVAGTDQVVPGHSLHRELELYVQAGMTPLQALQSATSVPARVLGLKDVGTIEAGKSADLVLLGADPLADIKNTRAVETVVARGRVFESQRLWTMVGFKP